VEHQISFEDIHCYFDQDEYKGSLLKDGMNLYQATGHYIKVDVNDDQVTIAGANVIGTVDASNGVVHVIDQVLLPPD